MSKKLILSLVSIGVLILLMFIFLLFRVITIGKAILAS
jgi:hypothetical protein